MCQNQELTPFFPPFVRGKNSTFNGNSRQPTQEESMKNNTIGKLSRYLGVTCALYVGLHAQIVSSGDCTSFAYCTVSAWNPATMTCPDCIQRRTVTDSGCGGAPAYNTSCIAVQYATTAEALCVWGQCKANTTSYYDWVSGHMTVWDPCPQG